MLSLIQAVKFMLEIKEYCMPRILNVTPHRNHTLEIELGNSHLIVCDMRPRLKTTRFCSLINLEKFLKVQVQDGNTLVWDSLCQITIDEILEMLDR